MGADPLTSPRSARVTEVRHLHDRRHRAQRGAFVVEGPPSVEAALGHGIDELFVSDSAAERHRDLVERARRRGARITPTTDAVLSAMSETQQSQGLLAVCPLVTRPVSDVLASAGDAAAARAPFFVLLDRVGDPGNAGTVIRTADALGADGVVLIEGSVDAHNGKCVRSTAGSIFHVPVTGPAPADTVLGLLRRGGIGIAVADGRGDVDLGDPAADALLRGPVAWVFGSEAHGVADSWRAAATAVVRIPMRGEAESLNLAAAAAICLYATETARS